MLNINKIARLAVPCSATPHQSILTIYC